MNVVDSSAWLEYLQGGPDAERFAGAIEEPTSLIVPTIVLFEVFKKICRDAGESAGVRVAGHMRQATVVDLTPTLALQAAQLGLELGLPMADSMILATTRYFQATLWTQDSDFEGLEGVMFFAKSKPA